MKEEILNLKNLIKYQKDSIVSKMLINKEKGSVTIFAFDQDQGLSEHTTPFDALVQIIEGNAEIKISGKKYIIKDEQAIIMPADKPHSVYAKTKIKMILIMIK